MIQAEIISEDDIITSDNSDENNPLEDMGNSAITPKICLMDQGGQRMDITEEVTGTLRACMGGNVPIVMGSTKPNAEICEDLSPTITASGGIGGGNIPLLFENYPLDCRYNGPLDVSPTLASVMGTGGNNGPIVANPIAYSLDSKESNSMKSSNKNSGCRVTEQSRTIDTTSPDPSKNQGRVAILHPQETYCIASNTINRQDHNGGNGLGVQKDISYTITTSDIHSICHSLPYQDVVGTLMHRDHKGISTVYVHQDKCVIAPYQNQVGALCRGDEKGISNQYVSQDKCIIDNTTSAINRNLVRRLTPLECERLQGFPDGWTDIPKASDSPRYKALGNSVAIPCVTAVMRGIAFFLNQQHESKVT